MNIKHIEKACLNVTKRHPNIEKASKHIINEYIIAFPKQPLSSNEVEFARQRMASAMQAGSNLTKGCYLRIGFNIGVIVGSTYVTALYLYERNKTRKLKEKHKNQIRYIAFSDFPTYISPSQLTTMDVLVIDGEKCVVEEVVFSDDSNDNIDDHVVLRFI